MTLRVHPSQTVSTNKRAPGSTRPPAAEASTQRRRPFATRPVGPASGRLSEQHRDGIEKGIMRLPVFPSGPRSDLPSTSNHDFEINRS
jgi:hypothetical protein